MDDLAFLRERIESYADYTNGLDWRVTDQKVRAYVGEALARAQARLQPSGAVGGELERVVLRCEFADQSFVHAMEMGDIAAAEVAALRAADRQLVAFADGMDAADADGLRATIDQIDRALERRIRIATAAAVAAPPAQPNT
jgi:hypothetical protein